MNNEFNAGDYVVLLSGCDGNNTWLTQMPINYCYKLRLDSNTFKFHPILDINNSPNNGWELVDNENRSTNNKLILRKATKLEEYNYNSFGKPFDVNRLQYIDPESINQNYDYLIPILKKIK
jgi:hypothetical protein